MEASWRSGTRKQYEGAFSKWKLYFCKRKVNPFSPTAAEGINSLGELYGKGIAYSGFNTARSALSAIITLSNNMSFGNHPSVRRFMKGVYETSRPSPPKHQEIWGVRADLEFLQTQTPAEGLSLKNLTMKLCMLLALISAQRCQTLKALSIDYLKLWEKSALFTPQRC